MPRLEKTREALRQFGYWDGLAEDATFTMPPSARDALIELEQAERQIDSLSQDVADSEHRRSTERRHLQKRVDVLEAALRVYGRIDPHPVTGDIGSDAGELARDALFGRTS